VSLSVSRVDEVHSRSAALGEGLLVAVIWSSSFVVAKLGLAHIGPLTAAGLRYFLGFIVLLPLIAFRSPGLKGWTRLSWRQWGWLAAVGVSAYTIANGAFFLALQYLPAVTVSFVGSLSPLLVLFMGVGWLRELPTRWQVVGVLLSIVGSGLFFAPGLKSGELVGLVIVVVGLVGFSLFGVLARFLARERQIDTLSRTALPLAIGGALLLAIAFPLEGPPVFPAAGWLAVLWLAVVNTALGYLLYHHAVHVLSAVEMNVLLNLCPLGAAALAWLLLGERLYPIQLLGVVVVIVGVSLVQRGKPSE
jgi:probable blue pigment (indigoidine) exporter